MTIVDRHPAGLRVQPMIGLEWSQAMDQPIPRTAAAPADVRGSWVHTAPETEVVALYLAARATDPLLPAPWWLRALTSGALRSRRAGLDVEDRVSALLGRRPGWVFAPWGADGDAGYWEYMPSERELAEPGMPTTLAHTDRHPGWIDVVAVHAGHPPAPIAVDGPADLRERLPRLEAVRP